VEASSIANFTSHRSDQTSAFYIKRKVEFAWFSQQYLGHCAKLITLTVLTIYFSGAIMLKAVAGSESLIQSLSFSLYGDRYYWA